MRGKEQEQRAASCRPATSARWPSCPTPSTGDTLAPKGTPVVVPAARAARCRCCPSPSCPKSKGDEDKLMTGLHRLQDEDPALHVRRDDETHQTLLSGMGETHLSIVTERLARKFGVEVRDRGREGRLPGDDHRHGRGRGQVQEADRRPRPVRRRLPAGRAPGAGRRLRVRRQDRRRGHPPPVHPRGREGRGRDHGRRPACSATRWSTCGSPSSTASSTPSTRRR